LKFKAVEILLKHIASNDKWATFTMWCSWNCVRPFNGTSQSCKWM